MCKTKVLTLLKASSHEFHIKRQKPDPYSRFPVNIKTIYNRSNQLSVINEPNFACFHILPLVLMLDILLSSINSEHCDCVCCSYEKGETLTREISPFPLAGYSHHVVTPISVTSNNMAEII